MEDVECSFESNKVQRMELTLLKALKWRLGPVTSYSYMELLTQQSIDLSEEFITTLTNLLLYSLLGEVPKYTTKSLFHISLIILLYAASINLEMYIQLLMVQ